VSNPVAIESYAVSQGGVILRDVRLSDGCTLRTPMGSTPRRRGEALDQWADRAFLMSTSRLDGTASVRPVRAFDLYCGCGGLSLGLVEACRAIGRSLQIAGAVDLDTTALEIYGANIPGAVTIRADATRLIDGRSTSRLTASERSLKRRTRRIDFLLAGPPCQGFSALNNHTRGDDPKNSLYGLVARAAQVMEPDHILIENVASVRSYSPSAVARAVDRLMELNYTVHEAVVPLVDLGIPQLRRRHVVVATVGREAPPRQVLAAFQRTPRNVRWAIGDLAGIRPKPGFDRPSLAMPENEKRMAYLRERELWDLPNHMRPDCHRAGDHTYKSMYGRLWWDRPAQTITSGYGSMGQGRYVHPDGRRTLTPHEAARLQFFPDWFDFGERSRSAWATAIGNAVPMKLSYVFGVWSLR
jgi:DNA (cytosine-5)-methyltransferase 1